VSQLGSLTRSGADFVVRSARRTARRAALSAALWALAFVFLCLMLGFGAVGLFLLLAVTQGAIVAAFSVAAIAGVFMAILVLVAINPAATHDAEGPETAQSRPDTGEPRPGGTSPETAAIVIGAGFLSGLFSKEK